MTPVNPTQNYDTNESARYLERLRIALKVSKTCIYEVDLLKQQYTFFENAEVIFGVPGDVILDEVRPFSELPPEEYRDAVSDYFSHPDDREVIADAFASIFRGEPTSYQARMRAGGSNFIWCQLHVTPIMEHGIPVRMIGVISDIMDLKSKNETLEEAAKLDTFTGLYNKNSSISLIRHILKNYAHQSHALVLIDIDSFKRYNDTYGHAAGDEVLITLASILKTRFRRTDVLGRFGGDEFLLLIRDISDTTWMADTLRSLTEFAARNIDCTNSLGVSIFPKDGTNFDTLFEKADLAMYHSKLTRKSCTFYSQEVCHGHDTQD